MSESAPAKRGQLIVAATPIGNLGDMSERLREALAQADVIACEDTRQTAKLLRHLGLSQPMVAYHEHNEQERADELADHVASGKTIVLVSDAGTPAISDPGFRVVRACHRRGLSVTPLPGPCAFVAVLSAAGLPTDQFWFRGFLKPKAAARRAFLTEQREAEMTIVLYESSHRIDKLAADMLEILGPDRVVCFAREVTKQFETILTGRLAELVPLLQGANLKGEFTVLIAPLRFSL